jgi:hypothetical protein
MGAPFCGLEYVCGDRSDSDIGFSSDILIVSIGESRWFDGWLGTAQRLKLIPAPANRDRRRVSFHLAEVYRLIRFLQVLSDAHNAKDEVGERFDSADQLRKTPIRSRTERPA